MGHKQRHVPDSVASSAETEATAQPHVSAPTSASRARRRAEVLGLLSRQRRRKARREPSSYRWPGTESA